MESLVPVPETERMEEFRSSIPTLRLEETSKDESASVRRSIDPIPLSPRSPSWSSSQSMPYRPRNTSPYSRGHLRSKSSTGSLAPQMSRAQSLPGVNGAGHLLMSPQQRPASPSSPRGSPNRFRTPRRPVDDVFPGLPNRTLRDINEAEPTISEEENTPKAMTERSSSPILGLPPNSFSRSRRPASPLRYIKASPANINATPTTPTSLGSSPSLQSAKFSEYSGQFSYPGSFASSSVPSTPTSARSRSPSISSLETIPDSPDAEEAALEADKIAQLKAAADAAEDGDDAKALGGPETPGGRGRTLGTGFGSRDKRKRWSVCGAERRGDINLDTIWED